MYFVKDKVLLLNSSAFISKQKSSFMNRINTDDWSSCELITLGFLCRTVIDERSASKTEKKIDRGNVLSQRGGVSQYIREAYGHKERKGHPQIT